jgi:fatty acid desaturase
MKDDSKKYREIIDRHIGRDAQRQFNRRSALRTLFTFSHIWLALALSFWVVIKLEGAPLLLHVLVSPFLIVFIGTRFNALSVQLHEGSHGSLLASKAFNDVFCNVFASYWVLNDVRSYWKVHREHHIHLHEASDPDFPLYALKQRNAKTVLQALLEDLFLISVVKRLQLYLSRSKAAKTGENLALSVVHFVGKLATLVTVFTLFVSVFGVGLGTVLYGVYWVIPLFSIYPVIIRIKIVTEHYSEQLFQSRARGFVGRTSLSNVLEAYLIGAQMEYHMEHHLYPNIPFYQLKRLHRKLGDLGFYERIEASELENVLSGGYFHFWKFLLFDKSLMGQFESERG